jgi:ATP-dependent Lhr-like helicase
LALQRRLERSAGFAVQLLYTDDGIALRMAESDTPPEPELLLPEPEDVGALITEQLADSALLAALFRSRWTAPSAVVFWRNGTGWAVIRSVSRKPWTRP